MRCILVILDGLGDRGCGRLGGRTPLKSASTPHFDELARLGMNGLYHSTFQGLARPSETAHFCMFGYDIDNLPERGVLEAVGEGIHISKGADDAVDRPYIHPSPKPLRIG